MQARRRFQTAASLLLKHHRFVQIKAEDVDMFLKGGAALDISSARKKPKVRCSSSAASHRNGSCHTGALCTMLWAYAR